MDIDLEPGKYVVAVSGGVDSVALLHLLHHKKLISKDGTWKHWKLIVGHFNHGVREDSGGDRKFVQELAGNFGFPFVYDEGRLGSGASEAVARTARYEFLRAAQKAAGARGIITAHHQDDVLETAVINLVRGTGRRGLSSLKSTAEIARPLLNVTKKDLLNYAHEHQLRWREDSTNQDTKYLRNHIRHNILPRFSDDDRDSLLARINRLHKINQEIDDGLRQVFQQLVRGQTSHIGRAEFIGLPHGVAREVMASWLRQHGVRGYDRKTLERLVVAAKTYRPGTYADVSGAYHLAVFKKSLALIERER